MDSIAGLNGVQSSPVFVHDQNDNDREPIPVRMVVLSTIFKSTRLFLPCPNPTSTINHQTEQRTSITIPMSVKSINQHWGPIFYINNPIPVRMLVLASNSFNRNLLSQEFHSGSNGRLGVEFDHGQGVARPYLCQMKAVKQSTINNDHQYQQ
jgi:hypothetical protein